MADTGNIILMNVMFTIDTYFKANFVPDDGCDAVLCWWWISFYENMRSKRVMTDVIMTNTVVITMYNMFVANVGPRTEFIHSVIFAFVESWAIELDVMSVVIKAVRPAKDLRMCLINMLDWWTKGIHTARYLSTAAKKVTRYRTIIPESCRIWMMRNVGKGAAVYKKVLSLQLRTSGKLRQSQMSPQHIATKTDQYGLPFNVRKLQRTIKCTRLKKNDAVLRTLAVSSAVELAHRSLSKSLCGTLLYNTSTIVSFSILDCHRFRGNCRVRRQ